MSWQEHSSADPELFTRLRELPPAEVRVRFEHGTGDGYRVEVPGASFTLQGVLRVEPEVDRISVEVPGWSAGDFAYFARRKGRGRTDYWQGAVEYHPSDRPALVFYFTAALDGLEIKTRPIARERVQSDAPG